MLKTIAILAIILAAAVASALVYAATKPDTFQVQRSMLIAAPADKIFPLIDDLHNWQPWSPYEKRDPAMKKTFSGSERGKGAVYEWDGNRDVGKGSVEITDVSAPSRITIGLHMIEPFEGRNVVEFTLRPQAGGTNVTWAMHGPSPYISKVMGLVLDMDKMIGNDFEAGLANLKNIAEKG